MIVGIGCDQFRTDRLAPAALAEGDAFRKRAFTEAELAQAERSRRPAEYLAGRFCAKEAVYKAVSRCGEEFHPGEIEILNDEDLRPHARLSGRTAEAFARLTDGRYRLHVSLSHEDGSSIAFAVAETTPEKEKG